MTNKPVVLVPTDVKDIDLYRWHATPETYLTALVNDAGVTPLLVPSFGEAMDIPGLLERCEGVLLTGSRSNVHPPRYGKDATDRDAPYDLERDATTLNLARAALDAGIPLFAICRGHQELNVALGGTLSGEIQEQADIMDHRSPESDDNDIRFRIAHTITLRSGGMLNRIIGIDEIRVNSLHRQAIETLAPGLTVEANAEDGTIEATSVDNAKAFALSVQWHPEYWSGSDAPSTKLFNAFGEACRAYQAGASRAA